MMKKNIVIQFDKKKYAYERKIYMDNYEPNKLTRNLLDNLDVYYKFTNNCLQMYSPSGIFIMEKENNDKNIKIIKQVPCDKPLKLLEFDNTRLILDESSFKEEHVISQIPFDNFYKEVTKFYYSQCEDSRAKEKAKLFLVVEGHYENKINNEIEKEKHKEKGKNKYVGFIPDNFYFLAKEEIDNYLMKKELNGFLSMLK